MKGIEMIRYHCMKCGKDLRSDNKTRVCEGCGKTFSEYHAWCAMKTRCTNKNHISYKNYGGRSITICDEWVNSFPNFYNDMGNKPSPDLSLDRKDNDGNYCKDNCKWSTSKEQINNRRGCKDHKDHKVRKNHPTGIKGITKYGRRFRSTYKSKYLGTSATIEEAQQKIKSYIEQITPA